jgi:hypothetical protein
LQCTRRRGAGRWQIALLLEFPDRLADRFSGGSIKEYPDRSLAHRVARAPR